MLQIGFMARLQITHGAEDTREMRKAVCELRIQAYNSKLKTPAGKTTSFKHTDCDWTRPGTDTPAPQSVVDVHSVSTVAAVGGLLNFNAAYINATVW